MKFLKYGFALVFSSVAISSAHALNAKDDITLIKGGVAVCPAGGVGTQHIRNINASKEIFFDKITGYDTNGVAVYDSSIDGFPVGFKQNLLPRNKTQLSNAQWPTIRQVWYTFQIRKPNTSSKRAGLGPMMATVFETNNETGSYARHKGNCYYQKITY